ncbi:MAG TPA: chemotaxis protein CheA [Magnetospirillaceae bacterium]|nr:chemotaxis protein CheA [Magnetospirillaceae bacterium]
MNATPDPVETFRIEANDLFEQLEQALLDIEDDPQNKDLIDTAFRALHTIKGSGAMFGFDRAAAFTHHVENAFDMVRKGTLAASPELVNIALSARDHIRALIDNPDGADSVRGELILEDLARLVGGDPAPPPPVAETAKEEVKRTTYRIHIKLALDALMTGGNPLLLLDELRELGDCSLVAVADAIPPLEEIDPFACYMQWDGVLTTDRPRSAIDDVFIFTLDDMELRVEEVEVEPKLLGEILVERGMVSPDIVQSVVEGQEKLGDRLVKEGHLSSDKLRAALAEQGHLKNEQDRAAGKDGGVIKVQAEKLDELMDQVGELVIAQARLRQLADKSGDLSLKSIVEEIERLSGHLRDVSMGIRMVPIGTLFGKFRRLVRDLSNELGKQVQLSWSGEETEIDKTVIERLHDPLVHLIRNSIDHGIEASGEQREMAGKPREGKVHLSAVHSGAQVLISIRDDGKGLDRDRIRAKAEETGLVAPDQELSDSELFHLIFHPGFSTAQKITSVSGRGVGMDVVKRMIDALRGTIDIESRPGEGATFTLRLPLTLAIIEGLLVRVAGERYVLPLSAVEECIELSPEDDARSTGRDFLNIRGDLVPFVRLRGLFDLRGPITPYPKVVVVSAGEFRFGVVVDQILGGHQTVIKSLSKLHADIPTFSGATILGDGSVALILDVPRLLDFSQSREGQLKAS